MASGVRHRLKRDRSHRRVPNPVPDDRADLGLVHPPLDRGDECHAQPGRLAVRKRALLDLTQVLAADRQMRALLETVELQIDVRP